MTTTYNREPETVIHGHDTEAWAGYNSIAAAIRERLDGRMRAVVIIECYPGVREQEIIQGLQSKLDIRNVIYAETAAKDTEELNFLLDRYLTDDRVFGYIAPFAIEDFYVKEKIDRCRGEITGAGDGLTLVIGFGASLITQGDLFLYADMTRWEIQLRYRSKEIGNWRADNPEEDILRKYKRGYFAEWRVADRLKRRLFDKADFYLDTNIRDEPKMATKEALRDGLRQAASQPLRLVPYFDPGVWGGYWMQEKIGLEPKANPYAWAFDGVPEENSLYFRYGDVRVELPSINLVFFEPIDLLGERVYARFGAEFPIRFDFLDTMGGQNLSLQVHPLTDYIRQQFGMCYTQDESYYMLDAGPDAVVYLGLKDGVDKDKMLKDLELAQEGRIPFPAEKYVNTFPAKKHDHFLIPAGTIHCSGKNGMVLEISATPYIFTFKLWDWGRLGLDGKPRPVHLEHGKQNIQWNRTTEWVDKNLVNQTEVVAEGQGWKEERTGLHEFEFIETRRHWFSVPVDHHTGAGVNVLNLIEGDEVVVESPEARFEPFVVHYAETFIIPASVGRYSIRPSERSACSRFATIKASVKK